MRILITGHSGFVGGHLSRHLRAVGAEVFGLDSEVGLEEGENTVRADLLDRDALKAAVRRVNPEVVVHLAGLSHVGESFARPGDTLRVNFGGTLNLVQAAGARRLIFASSAEVYGNVPAEQQPIAEDRPLEPRSPYAMTKACSEGVAAAQGAVIVRSFNAVGPGQSQRFALPSFARQLRAIARQEHEAVLRVGDLSPQRDFLHIQDVVTGYQTLIERGAAGQAYNVASGVATSIRDALARLLRIAGVTAQIEPDPERLRPVDIPLLCGDSRRLRALGWAPRFGLDDALADLWQVTILGA